jgi:single stranded DNA-binding protein
MSSISINNCVFMGRLTGEPEMRYTRSNKPVTTFRIAVSRRSSADVTDFIPCVTYGAQAEFVSQWFQKGTLAIVIGQLTSHMWVDKNTGKTRVDYEIQCDNVQFGETKKQRIAREQEQPPQAAEPEETPVPQNEQERSGLQIVAVDTLTGNVLANAVYDLYTMDGATVSLHNGTDADGIASIVGLSAGDYIITEVTAPTGFRPVARSVNVNLEPGINHSITFPHSAEPAQQPQPSIPVYNDMPTGYVDDDRDVMI